ncbi:hypothetical protein EMCRGX_G012862 [Ephydatia muelleri]
MQLEGHGLSIHLLAATNLLLFMLTQRSLSALARDRTQILCMQREDVIGYGSKSISPIHEKQFSCFLWIICVSRHYNPARWWSSYLATTVRSAPMERREAIEKTPWRSD